MKIPGEYFDQTFQALVGNPDTTQQLTETLSQDVRIAQKMGANTTGQYHMLEASAIAAFNAALPSYEKRLSLGTLREALRIDGIARNGPIGVSLSIAALQSTDLLYRTHTQVPQQEENVQKNTRKILGAAYGIAQTGKHIAKLNIAAYRLGVDPRETSSFLLAALESKDPSDSFHRAFSVTSDDTDQLHFSPKFKRLGAVRDRQCPAIVSRIDSGDRAKPALWSFMNVIGGVAISEIFPRQFVITPKNQ